MLNKKHFKAFVLIMGMLIFSTSLFAHNIGFSILMIYEQNGKHFVVFKSSLTAFEAEIKYHFKENTYKTPQEFNDLVIQYFKKKCIIVFNEKPINFKFPQVLLGHETSVFAELENMPHPLFSCYIKNTFFEDMPYNQCELILSISGIEQKQFVFNKENKYDVKFSLKKHKWEIEKNKYLNFSTDNLFLWICAFLIILTISFLVIKNKTFRIKKE